MGDETIVVRGAAVQAAPVFLDREATVDKASFKVHESTSPQVNQTGLWVPLTC